MTNLSAIKKAMQVIDPEPQYRDFVFHDLLKIVAFLNKCTIAELYEIQNKPCAFKESRLLKYINLYKNGTPLAYVLNQTFFYNLELKVDKRVLIPRVETEQLVDEIISLVKQNFTNQSCLIYEIGTGSGAIALAIAKNLANVKVIASDISQDALDVARYNRNYLHLTNVDFIHGNLTEPFEKLSQKCDILIFNPPYLDKDSKDVQKSVKDFEPAVALFAPDKGLAFYTDYLKKYKNICKQNAIMGFEIGYDLKDSIMNYLIDHGYSLRNFYFLKDLNNLWRNLIIKL